MQSTDRAEFVRVLNGLAAIKGKDLTPEAISLWWSAMARWEIDEFKAAASHLVGSCQFMPSPYDFEQLRKAGEPTAHEAWDIALCNCTSWRNGNSRAGTFIDRVVRLIGGYRAIAMADERELSFIQRRFMEAYETQREVEPVRDALPEVATGVLDRLSLKRLT